jgi:hypothetical protein
MGTGVALPLLSPGKKIAVPCVVAVAIIGVFPSRALVDLFQEVRASIGAGGCTPGRLSREQPRSREIRLKACARPQGRALTSREGVAGVPLQGPRGTSRAAQDGGSWRIGERQWLQAAMMVPRSSSERVCRSAD